MIGAMLLEVTHWRIGMTSKLPNNDKTLCTKPKTLKTRIGTSCGHRLYYKSNGEV